jgi:hypothetical protein
MVTNHPHLIAHDGSRTTATAGQAHAEGSGGRVMDWLHQTLCGLRGHERLLHFEQERMSLRCASCGHETPGWDLNETPPTITIRVDRRHALARPQLVGARRIA